MDEERWDSMPNPPADEPDEARSEDFDETIDDILAEAEALSDSETPDATDGDVLPDEDAIEPSDFPNEDEYPLDSDEAPPTVLRRTPRKPRPTAHKVLHGLLIAGKWVLAVVLVLAILVGGGIGYLTLTEYTPAYAEAAQYGAFNTDKKLTTNTLRILTFNTGYAGLDADADFFMDGGSGVKPDSVETVERNMSGIERILKDSDADVLLLQEVDTDAARTFEKNQWLQYEHALSDYESRFALNYSCNYVPYPLKEPIGKIHSGIATYSRYDLAAMRQDDPDDLTKYTRVSSTRYSLPCPFSWPTRVANLKRCLLVTRIPLDGKAKELVIVNLHLEAYDDGEGKRAQTEQLMELLTQEYAKGNYVIAGGDFNQSFPEATEEYRIRDGEKWQPGTLEELPTDWQYAYDLTTPSCRLLNRPYSPASSETQYYVIDGYIVSPNVQVDAVQTLDEGFEYSDHNPVLLEITLKDE